MKLLCSFLGRGCIWATVLAAGTVLTGCQALNPSFGDWPDPGPDQPGFSSTLRVGDLITVTFTDLPTPMQPHEERIKEDGTITLHLNQSFNAAGKTAGQLQQEIRARYVPKYYLNMTVTVKVEGQFFSVDGEVRQPSRHVYLGQMTVLGAIATAGGFTDFANKRKVQVIRASKEKMVVDCIKAQQHPERDLPVYPGDKVIVPRRFW